MEEIIRLENITKTYGLCRANAGVDISVNKGEIHAIIGENGAGKSTAMKILYGMESPDEGRVYIKGKPQTHYSPFSAINQGVGMVHQHFMLFENLTVWENLVCGMEPSSGIALNKSEAVRLVKKYSEEFSFGISADTVVSDLSVGNKQRIEIMKILYRNSDILILDEPTAVLTPQEVVDLFRILSKLKNEGKTIILITHKLKEVLAVSDRVTAMRQGKVTGVRETKGMTESGLAMLLVGHELKGLTRNILPAGNPVLELKNISYTAPDGKKVLQEVSFSVRENEIVGIAGVTGNGQTELIEIISGMIKQDSGSVLFDGAALDEYSVQMRLRAGLAHIPEDRLKNAVCRELSAKTNALLGYHSSEQFRKGVFFIDYDEVDRFSAYIMEKYDVVPRDPDMLFSGFSGGNQQKFVVGRELERKGRIIIAAQPTRGVDIGAIEMIHSRLLAEKARGSAILLVSSELSEIFALSDRIAVMYSGRICAVVDAKDADEMKIGLLMTCGSPSL